ncbi:MAG: hypothetical protein JKX70_07865 [Phycisphaerales bacterium]|nr:hypothetical protein [Phycisphaerales bacterium]
MIVPRMWAVTDLDDQGHGWMVYHWYDQTGLIETVRRTNSSVDMRGWPTTEQYQGNRGKIPHWSKANILPTNKEKESLRNYLEVVVGWPFRAWSCEYSSIEDDESSGQTRGGLQWEKNIGVDYPLLFPLSPKLPGFIWNACFYSLLVLGLHHLVLQFVGMIKAMRNTRRKRKSLCPHCAYDITGLSICPECGQAIEVATS